MMLGGHTCGRVCGMWVLPCEQVCAHMFTFTQGGAHFACVCALCKQVGGRWVCVCVVLSRDLVRL